jgi:hypothetical protein
VLGLVVSPVAVVSSTLDTLLAVFLCIMTDAWPGEVGQYVILGFLWPY